MKAADCWVGHKLNGRALCRGRIETLYDQNVGESGPSANSFEAETFVRLALDGRFLCNA
jgi:hypothetical protein